MKQRIFYLYFHLFFCLCLFALLGIATPLHAQTVSPFELGGQIHTFLHPDEMHDARMKWLKMQITWRRGGSTADAQNVINHARRNQFKVLLSIKGLKDELAANPTQYYQDFAAFLAQVALLNPEAIEVWNEPNIDQEWPVGLISGTAYAQMLARAYPAIKAANSNVMVISGAPAPTGYFGGGCTANGCDDKIFIEQMAAAGAASNFDCTGIHYNEGVLPPTASSGDPRGNPNHYTRYYPTMVSTYRTVFPTKPLCFTELGYISPEGLGGLPAGLEWGLNTSAQEQAQWLAQAAVLSRDGGLVRLMIVWNVDAPFTSSNPFAGWAIIRTNNQCLPCATLRAVLPGGPETAPTLVAPVNAALLNTNAPQFQWNAVPDATSYRLQIDNHANFASPERTHDQAGTTYTVSPSLPDNTYYWRVRGVNSDGSGPWSAARQFMLDTQPPSVPALLAPSNNRATSERQSLFTWGAVATAIRYELRLDSTNPPSMVVFSGNALSFRPPAPLALGTHYWQVRAFDLAGNASAWSSPFVLTIESAPSAAPAIRYVADNTVVLTWSPVTWAVEYAIEVDDNSSFAFPLEYQAIVGSTLTVTTPPLDTGIHYWRVQARHADGTTSGWSPIESFQIAP